MRQVVTAALLTGFLYYGIGLSWLLFYEAWIYLAALLALAPVFALYFLLLAFATRNRRQVSLGILGASLLWILLHKAYSLSPLGTGALEAPFYGPLALMQIASVLGFEAIPGILTGIQASLAWLWIRRNLASGLWLAFFTAVLLGTYFWGKGRLERDGEKEKDLRFALIQHNLPISGRWNLEHPEEIRETYRRLAREAAKERPRLIVFPLYNFPGDPLRDPQFFTALAEETGSYILMAGYIPQKAGGSLLDGFFNTAILYSPEGSVAGDYQAVEAPPFRQISEKTGKEYKIFDTPFGKIGVLLCYEDTRPRLAKAAVRMGADHLIALSNPGHFTSTHLPYYHLMQDRLRAIESGRPLWRVSANGYSAEIDRRGRILQRSPLRQESILQTGRERG